MTSPFDASYHPDVTELVDQTAGAADAWMRGDIDRYLALTRHAPGFTLTAPTVAPRFTSSTGGVSFRAAAALRSR